MSLQYQKRPAIIEALPCTEALRAASNAWHDLPDWLSDAYETGSVIFGKDAVYIQTLEGQMTAGIEDWIICGIAGELYPCKDAIFRELYDKVSP